MVIPSMIKSKLSSGKGYTEEWTDDLNNLGVFYFAEYYAAHTNNVINYVESHDENSVPWK